MPTTHFKSIKREAYRAAVSALSSYSTVSNWETKLTTAGFKILKGKKTAFGVPEDLVERAPNLKQVLVEKAPHNTIVLTFFQSYTQGQGTRYVLDKHGSAQRQVMREVVKEALDILAHKDVVVDSTLRRAGLGGAGAISDIGGGISKSIGKQFQRLHGGAGSNNAPLGFGNRSDTTVHLIDALQQLGNEGLAQDITAYAQEEASFKGGVTNTQIKSITSFLNQEFNAAYKIEGMSKIDVLGSGFEIDKDFVIKIAVGSANQNSLMKRADAMKKGAKKGGLQGFFKSIENRLLDKFQKDPAMKTSLSMAEMMERGVFAGITKKMKTASGMPDMRFKVNKDLYNKAKYKEKTSGQRFIKVKKGSKKTVKRRAEQKHVIPKPSNNAGSSFKNQDFNPLALEALLNELLPKVVASKMTSPALNYRTGRFAESAEVEEVMIGQRGGLNVNYTYQKDPYQTFEPGFARGSTYRDPRKIIGESVREIAQSMIGNKFLRVRRV